jgi:hypothetical protein
MALGHGQALQKAIKQHLNELHIVGRGNAGHDLDGAITLSGTGK